MVEDYSRLLRQSRIVSPIHQIPVIERQDFDINEKIELIAFSDTSANPTLNASKKGIHFFMQDQRFERVYRSYRSYFERLRKYRFALSPDFSVYTNMPEWRQIESVAHNRWCGACWQENGIKVFPTISWGQESTFEFCFAGVEKGSTVAVSTLGCRNSKEEFMLGYNAMMEAIEPEHIICFSKPFPEMAGDVIYVEYLASRRGNR